MPSGPDPRAPAGSDAGASTRTEETAAAPCAPSPPRWAAHRATTGALSTAASTPVVTTRCRIADRPADTARCRGKPR
ncbi:hypothetical protein GCM10025734_40100 [Kitasatospora paranensis]